jgi:MFS family permease
VITAIAGPALGTIRARVPNPAILWLAASSGIGSLGLAAGGVAGSLLAEDMTGLDATTGLPLAMLTAGAVVGAIIVSRLSARVGRRAGLVLGYLIGICGAALVVGSATAGTFPGVLVGSLVLGAANPAIFLSRYAAAAVEDGGSRGRAMGTVLLGSTVGAVVGPNALAPTGVLAAALGLSPAVGLYLLAIPAFGLAAAAIAAAGTTRAGRSLARPARIPAADGSDPATLRDLLAVPRLRSALGVLAAANLIMVGIMAVIPVHMAAHGQDLQVVGLVVSIHLLAMFAPSPVTGALADRYGGARVAAIGGGLLVSAGVAVWLASSAGIETMTGALILLGVGWNCGIVGGSADIASSVRAEVRPQAEGVGEMALGIAAAAGGSLAGAGMAAGGMAPVALGGTVAGVVMLLGLSLPRRR